MELSVCRASQRPCKDSYSGGGAEGVLRPGQPAEEDADRRGSGEAPRARTRAGGEAARRRWRTKRSELQHVRVGCSSDLEPKLGQSSRGLLRTPTEVAKIDGQPLQTRTLEAHRHYKRYLGTSRSANVAFGGAIGMYVNQFHAK